MRLRTQDAWVERLRAALPSTSSWRSFYSSLAGGIVTDSALMFLPIDDHMVHRGHAGTNYCTPVSSCHAKLACGLHVRSLWAAYARDEEQGRLVDVLLRCRCASEAEATSLRQSFTMDGFGRPRSKLQTRKCIPGGLCGFIPLGAYSPPDQSLSLSLPTSRHRAFAIRPLVSMFACTCYWYAPK